MQILPALKAIGLLGSTALNTLEKLQLKIPSHGACSEASGIWLYNLQADSTQFILNLNEGSYSSTKAHIESDIPQASHAHWELKNILAGHFPFGLDDVDKYTPQELHFDQTGYISFSKGCYTGQEIIARMHYRGKVKKRLYLLQIEKFNNAADHNEIEIVDGNGKTLGFPLKQIVDDSQTLFAIASLPVELAPASLFTREGQVFVYRPLTAE